ncbi:MAG: hypothetical protein HY934_08370 [Candidatus Firestonebacteria bacterium]|nr:hypothetical protein [Candidatus Firestonebacteria bacterium]
MYRRNINFKKKMICSLSIHIVLILFLFVNIEAKIKLISPGEKSLSKNDVMVLIGEIIGADSIDVLVNSKDKRKLKIDKNTFYDRINLIKGENNIKVTASSQGKQVDSVDINIYFAEDLKSSKNPKDFNPFYIHTMLVENGECTECHDLKLSVDKYELKKGDRGLCFNCHDERLDVKYVHGPVAGGACLSCHNPHGSPYEFTVRMEGDKLCYFCHEEDRIKTDHIAKLKAEEAKKTCTDCHDVHGNNNEYFIKK